jgi:hypothetical protein
MVAGYQAQWQGVMCAPTRRKEDADCWSLVVPRLRTGLHWSRSRGLINLSWLTAKRWSIEPLANKNARLNSTRPTRICGCLCPTEIALESTYSKQSSRASIIQHQLKVMLYRFQLITGISVVAFGIWSSVHPSIVLL